ncbi:MAG: NADH:flavin oxidoreductase [Chloroflexi bacterium]|nr:NADH:flavin oxidoreductase [Chloroflexota bacterium]
MNSHPRFRRLLEPGRIGQLQLKNRLVMAPMGVDFCGEDGSVNDAIRAYYEERARGGVGLIIVGVVCVDYPRGKTDCLQLGISDDKFIPGLSQLAEAIHRHGAKAVAQLHHGGRMSAPDITGFPSVAASPIPLPGGQPPIEVTAGEIARIVECYAQAAERARKAGLDGVEIHAAHGYLIDSFLSRETNKRQDAYGGGRQDVPGGHTGYSGTGRNVLPGVGPHQRPDIPLGRGYYS